MIGVFDSGAGGLCALKELSRLRPASAFLYYADTAALPFGEKSPAFIRERIRRALSFFKEQGADAVLFACGTASSYLTGECKQSFTFPIFDILTPAAQAASGFARVGLIATKATVARAHFAAALAASGGRTVFSLACPTLVPLAEEGGRRGRREVRRALSPLVPAAPDALVLGCTHFSLLQAPIARALPRAVLIDAAAHAAKAVADALPGKEEAPLCRFAVTGRPEDFYRTACRVLGRRLPRDAFFKV